MESSAGLPVVWKARKPPESLESQKARRKPGKPESQKKADGKPESWKAQTKLAKAHSY